MSNLYFFKGIVMIQSSENFNAQSSLSISLSIVVSCYNEELTLNKFYKTTKKIIDEIKNEIDKDLTFYR